jgi:predicted nuclease with TOPRIM domain
MDKDYKTVKFLIGNDIEDAVKELLDYKAKGILVKGEFNGCTLYSDTVTVDGAYKEITSKTKAEFDKSREEWKENYDKAEKEHTEKIPSLTEEWIGKGHELLTEDKWELWDRIVPIRLGDLYHGMELGACLDIVKILHNSTLDEAKKEIEKQGHSGMSWGLVCSMVKAFSDKGEEFVKFVN